MNKKYVALAITAIMILGLFPGLTSIAKAQTVVPLGGGCTVADSTGRGSPFCVFLHPGQNDNFRTVAWSHTLGTLWGTDAGAVVPGNPGTPDNNPQTRQVFDHYLDYAILSSTAAGQSIGDLQFDFELPPATLATAVNITRIEIFVPPEFKWTAPTREESIWTDITNDYNAIGAATMSAMNTQAPTWVRVRIGQEVVTGGRILITNLPTVLPNGGVYHVRLFGLAAPEIAGLYHFKIYATWGPAVGGPIALHDIGVQNFPILVVKGELNPAWVEVTAQTHAFFAPPYVSGQVIADGTTPDGRAVQGMGYWSVNDFIGNVATPGAAGAQYRVYLFGLPAGTYTITAQASGFNPTTTDRFTILAGQSYHMSMVLFNSPIVAVELWSKHGTGAIPWHNLWQMPYGTNNPDLPPNDNFISAYAGTPSSRDTDIQLFDSSGNLIGFWASDTIHGATQAAPWVIPGGPYNGFIQKDIPPPNMLVGLHDDNYAIPGYAGGSPVGGTQPTHTNYLAELVDNFDPTWAWATGTGGNLRLYPSTHWDGHVPWAWADYVAGYPQAQYTIEAYVTGYIMDGADAYQRTFTVNSLATTVQVDLRRSNWIETTIHLPPGATWAGPWTTMTLVAQDSSGNERGAAAFYVAPWMVVLGMAQPNVPGPGVVPLVGDERIDGLDASWFAHPAGPYYDGGVIIEGWNAVYPNIVGAGGASRNAQYKDYGLNPTASKHTPTPSALDGSVDLAGNPYTIKLYMADMGTPAMRIPGTGWYNPVGGDPQTSVFLCNSPVPLSFSVVNASLWISLRSTDFELPAHSRPWTFPGSEIWVDFVNAVDQNDAKAGSSQAILDPMLYGLIQDPGALATPFPYGTWPIIGQTPACPPAVCGYGVSPYDVDINNPAGQHEHVGVHFYGADWSAPGYWVWWNPLEYTLLPLYRSTRLPEGQYTMNAYTHGYIQRRSFPVQVPAGGWADIEGDLIQGGQVRVLMDFFHEKIATEFNGWIRVEVFNAKNQLVGASIYGEAQPNFYDTTGGGGTYLVFGAGSGGTDNKVVWGPAEGSDFGISGPPTALGNDALFPSSIPGISNGQRGFISSLFYHSNMAAGPAGQPAASPAIPNPLGAAVWSLLANTWANWPGLRSTGWAFVPIVMPPGPYWTQTATRAHPGFIAPIATGATGLMYPAGANRFEVEEGALAGVDVYGFHQYFGDAARTWAGGFPTTNGYSMSGSWIDSTNGGNYWIGTDQWDYGIPGSVDVPGWAGSGGGLYSVKVWAFDPTGPGDAQDRVLFQPDETFARSGANSNWQMYAQRFTLENVQIPWGGSQALFVDMDAMASLRGTVSWSDMFGNLRPLPWAQISATNPDTVAYAAGYGGAGIGASDPSAGYIMWLPAGSHDVTVSTSMAPGIWAAEGSAGNNGITQNSAFTVPVQDGWVVNSSTQLSGSGTPVPEIPAYLVPLGLFAALAASAWLLRKRNLNIPVLMK